MPMHGGRSAAELLKQVIAATRDAVVFIDSRANIVLVNDAASEMFGYASDELLGRPVVLLMPEPYASYHAGYIERYEATGVGGAISRIRNVMGVRSDGELFPIELSVTKIDDAEVRYAAVLRDISERSRIERQLEEKERLAAIGMQASIFAHEVGNPLNNMYIHAQMLQRRVARLQLQDTVGASLDRIMDEIRRLTELLFEFRELYQPAPMTVSPVSLVVLLGDVIQAQLTEVRGRVEVTQDLEPGLPAVLGNRDKLKQVLINLCKNALEAMPGGGQLSIRARSRDDRVVLEIRDTGVGIPADVDPFAPFTTTKPDGSGLGLSVVRRIIADHGGTIEYESTPEGTVFVLTLRAMR